jgi:heme oxygenase (mycobilin-producing)
VATLINPFEVPPAADDAFLASWRRDSTLYRALREDVDFRFVEVAPESGLPEAGGEFPSHPGLYEFARVDGMPDVDGGVVLINPFEVPDDADERFLAGWDRARDVLAEQRGYLGTRLHRSVAADFRFVNVARWSSPLMFARAREDPRFREAAQAIPFPSHPALYQPAPASSSSARRR